MIVASDGRILFHNDPAQQNKIVSNASLLEYLKAKKDAPLVMRDYQKNDYEVAIPIYDTDNKRAGAAVVDFSLSPIVQKRRDLINYSLLVTLFSLAIAISLLSFFINLWINQPLRKLILAIQEISKKGTAFNGRVAVDSKDELGELAAAFNNMTEDLQKTTVSRDALVKEVSERRQAEIALRESESKRRTLLANIPQKIFIKI
jgi:nitrate/nitrite-specific signal transduction histidine kinase